MKSRVLSFILPALLSGSYALFAQDGGTGIVWGTSFPSEPLVLNEKFTGFPHFHSQKNTNDSNSRNTADAEGNITAWGYKNDSVAVPITGSKNGKINYKFYQCAFAPNWQTAWGYRDSLPPTSNPNLMTANVSRGFTEISRLYTSHYTVDGYFQIDLRALEFVEVVQYSHSSCGGLRRGLKLEFSLNDGKTWDTLRYQPGDAWAKSFTKDVTTLQKTSNTFNCSPSAYGMTWEEGIYASNVMLRFGIANNQALRIHDLKVYGTVGATSASKVKNEELRIYQVRRNVHFSKTADVAVYNISGTMIRMARQTNQISLTGLPSGMYLIKGQSGHLQKTSKIILD